MSGSGRENFVENRFLIEHVRELKFRDGIKYGIELENSYAAATLTGIILKIINAQRKINFANVLQRLLEISKKVDILTDPGVDTYRLVPNIECPVILFDSQLWIQFESFFYYLKDMGYSVEGVADINKKPFIPIQYHVGNTESLNKIRITDKLVGILGKIYEPDILLMCLNISQYIVEEKIQLIDLRVLSKDNRTYIYNERIGYRKVCSIEEIYEILVLLYKNEN
ncbi:MAG: hypothetical protein Q4F83_03980 [Eubacteriales bacterium]|nr:hypothetical protein [Eubacteriales bacterium]